MIAQPIQSKNQIFDLLTQHQADIKAFGVARIGLFGSFARNQQNESSDIDLRKVKKRSKI